MTRSTRSAALVAAVAAGLLAAPAMADPTPGWVATHPVQQQSQHRLAALPDGTGWAVVDHNRVVKSSDFGRTWEPVTLVTAQVDGTEIPGSGPDLGGSSETYVAPLSAKTAYGANGIALSRTDDGGRTWQSVPVPPVTRSKFLESTVALEHTGGRIWMARDGAEYADGCPYALTTTPLLSSADGKRWQRSDIPFAGGMVDEVRFSDARHGVALVVEFEYTETTQDENSCGFSGMADSSGVYVTANGGRTWRRTFECRPMCRAVSWSTPGRVVVGRLDGEIFASDNRGARFTSASRLQPPVDTAIRSLDGLDCRGRRCFASFNGGGIFRSDDAGAEWESEASPNDAYFLAIGDLAMFDAERAVAIGPYSILTRERTPAAASTRRGTATRGSRRPVSIGSGVTVQPDGTMRRSISVPLTSRSRAALARRARTSAAVVAAGGVPIVPGFAGSELLAVGDLDRDGTADLVDYRYYADISTDTPTDAPTLTAHSGRYGRVLWTRVVPPASALLPWSLGAGRSGVVLLTDDEVGTFGGSFGPIGVTSYEAYTGGLQLAALGSDGATVWSKRLVGAAAAAAGTDGYVRVPSLAGFGRFTADGVDDILIGSVDEAGSGSARLSQLTATVVDGVTGAESVVLQTAAEFGRALWAARLGDIDGDRRDDVAVVEQTGSNARVAAYGSAGGSALRWRGTDLPASPGVELRTTADVTGDRVADVLLLPAYTSRAFTGAFRVPGEVSMVDGRTGATRWTKPADRAAVAADREARSAPGVLLLSRAVTAGRVTATLMRANGTAAWTTTRAVASPKDQRRIPLSTVVEAGDVTGDGVLDAAYRIEVEPSSGPLRVDAGVIDGRTGRRSALPAEILEPVRAALDARGTDLVSTAVGPRGLTVTGVQGSTGRTLWRSAVAGPAGLDTSAAHPPVGARLDGDRCADVVVTVRDDETIGSYALSGRDGSLLWSLVRRGRLPVDVGRGRRAPVARTCS